MVAEHRDALGCLADLSVSLVSGPSLGPWGVWRGSGWSDFFENHGLRPVAARLSGAEDPVQRKHDKLSVRKSTSQDGPEIASLVDRGAPLLPHYISNHFDEPSDGRPPGYQPRHLYASSTGTYLGRARVAEFLSLSLEFLY